MSFPRQFRLAHVLILTSFLGLESLVAGTLPWSVSSIVPNLGVLCLTGCGFGLIGGCLYVVLVDALRYAVSRTKASEE